MPLQEIPKVKYLEADNPNINPVKITGASKPLSFWCSSNPHGDPELYVIKLYYYVGSNDINFGRKCLAKEVFTSLLAHVLLLNTPDIAIITIPDDLPSAVRDQEISDRLKLSLGLNFGSKEIRISPLEPGHFNTAFWKKAAEIIVFDTLICNSDRNKRKKNILETSSGYFLIDHEKAFGFTLPLLGANYKIWEDPITNAKLVKDHYFFPDLRGKIISEDVDDITERISLLSDDILYNIIDNIPVEWQSEDIIKISDYILDAAKNAQKLSHMVLELLS